MNTDASAHEKREDVVGALDPLYATCITFIVLNSVFVFARFFAVTVLRKSKVGLWWDDFWIIPSYLCNIGIIICALKTRAVHTNLPMALAPAEPLNLHKQLYPQIQTLLKLVYAMTNLLIPVFFTTRISILALYLRIFSDRKVRFSIYLCAGLVVAQWVACQLVAIFVCTPVNKWWNPIKPGGHCVESNGFYRGISYPTLVLDVFLIVLPIPSVWRLRFTKLRRTALTALFLTSILALIASAYRTYTLQTHDITNLSAKAANVIMAWIVGETGMYLIVACLPALAPLFAALIPASVRRAGAGAIHDSRYAPPSSAARSDFERLVDSDVKSLAGGNARNQVLAESKAAIELGERNVNAENSAGIDGVLVHTEIIVTEEEKIGAILGI